MGLNGNEDASFYAFVAKSNLNIGIPLLATFHFLSAQIKGLCSTGPVLMLPAPGPNLLYTVLGGSIRLNFGTVAYAQGGAQNPPGVDVSVMSIGWGLNAGGDLVYTILPNTVIEATASSIAAIGAYPPANPNTPNPVAQIVNLPLYLMNYRQQGGGGGGLDYLNGDGTIDLDLLYMILDATPL